NSVPEEFLTELEPFRLIGRKYYFIAGTEMNWFQAAQECRKMGGNLISLANDQERLLVGLELDKTQTFWVDITTLGQNNYVSIATGQQVEYVNLFKEEDDDDESEDLNEQKNCVKLVYDYQDNFLMRKTHCLDKARFICQLPSPRTVSVLVW
ncbi:hypothetical protein KR222_006181, partial [Zaprionus bogoriensis]